MKKVLLIILSVIVAITAMGQDVTRYPIKSSGGAIALTDYTPYYANQTSTTQDTVSTYRDSLAVTFMVNKPEELYLSALTKITDVSAGGKVRVVLKGKKFGLNSWTDLQTVYYYGGGSDTTINLGQDTAKLKYNYYMVLFKYVAGKTKPETVNFSFKK